MSVATMYEHRRAGATPILSRSGRSLAHAKLTPRARTNLALAIVEKRLAIHDFTVRQAAALTGASPYSVNAERHRRKARCKAIVNLSPVSTATRIERRRLQQVTALANQ